jgi:hypothetical protein
MLPQSSRSESLPSGIATKLSERITRYLAAMPASISGAGGDNAVTKAAWALIHGFGLTPEQALPFLSAYNANASPPWPESVLPQKLAGADRAGGVRGYLLRDTATPGRIHRPPPTPALAPPKPPRPRPETRRPTPEVMEQIATLRGVSGGAVYLASAHGCLSVGTNRGLPAFFFHGDGVFQARRLDGMKWAGKDGVTFKADTIGPVTGFGIGCGITKHTTAVIIVEGLAGLLEAMEAVLRADNEAGGCHEGIGVLAAVSATSRLSDKQAVYLSTRRVLILADEGHAGAQAAKGWRRAIKDAGGTPQVLQFSEGDLANELRSAPECPSEIRSFIAPPIAQTHSDYGLD